MRYWRLPHPLKENMVVILEFINGLQFGLEHISGEEDEDEYHYAIVVNFALLRIVFMKMKEA